jgi:hypothetical protein
VQSDNILCELKLHVSNTVVQTLDFSDGGWDGGANAPFEQTSDGSRRFGKNRAPRGGRGGDNSLNDYTRDPSDSSSVDDGAVNDLLSQRNLYRRKGMFDEADGIRDKLLNIHGVTVWDKDRVWTTAPQTGRGGGGGRGKRDGGRGGRGGGRGDRFGGGRGRGSGRGRGRERELNQHGHDYYQAGGPIDPSICKLPEREIHMLIRERMECKMSRNFDMADSIERELLSYGVDIHDGYKEWRADGQGWSRGAGSRGRDQGPREPKVYTQRGPGKGLSEEDINNINKLVAERSEAKASSDYDRADAIFAELGNTYNVNVDDREGQWALTHEEYQMSSYTAIVPDEEVQMIIGKKLADRILARKSKKFELADQIRQELKDEYVVDIDDKKKEWKVMQPEGGAKWLDADDLDDNFDLVSKDEFDSDDEFGDEEESEDDDFEEAISAELDEDTSVGEEDADLSSLTVPELKEKLRSAGLPVSGKN